MSKTELVAAIAEKTGLTKKDSEAAVNAFIGTVTEQLKKGEKVQLIGFGTFEVSAWEILCNISNLSNMYNVTAMLPRMAPWSSWLVIRPFQGCDAGSIPAGVILPLFPFFCGGRLIKTS